MTTETLEAVALLAEVCGALEAMGARAPVAHHPAAVLYLRRWMLQAKDMVDAAEMFNVLDDVDPLALVDVTAELRRRVVACQTNNWRPVPRFTNAGCATKEAP